MTAREQKRMLSIQKKIEEILSSTLGWDKTAYHGDIVIINIDRAAEKIVKYLRYRLTKGKK